MSEQTRYPDETLRDYVKGRLPAGQTREIETAAGGDAALAAEIALVRGIVQSSDAVYCRAPPAEIGWAKLSRAIDAEAGKRSLVPSQFSRWQVAAVALVAVAVSGLAVGLMPRAGEQGGYQTATARPVFPHAALATFNPAAQESAIREALRSVDAEIVAGPSALGVYMLAFKTAEAQTRGIDTLRARAGLVETVQAN
jgi:anti-sigma factor RsiW